jgi:hypothetical protein
MKARRLVIALVLLTALLVPTMVSAQGWTYGSSFQLQNLSSTQANVTITYYNQDGSVATSVDDTIPADGSKTYFAVSVPDLGTSFNGSAVVSSDQELRAIHNLDANSFTYGASSAGYTAGSTEISLPLIMRNNSGFNTWFNVQNAGSATATVSVVFNAGSAGTNYTHPDVTIEPGASYTFRQADMADLGSTFIGSAQITSNGQPLVATAVEVGPNTLYAYDGFASGSTDIVAPLFQYYNAGFSSSLQVQNVGSAATEVTLQYEPSSAGTACQETHTINPGKAATFGLAAFAVAGNDCYDANPGTAFVGSVRVATNSASQPLVAIVNQHNFSTGKAAAYSAFSPDDATQCVSLPLIMDRNSNWWTAFSLINIGAATNVTVDYTNVSAADETFSLGAGESAVRLNYGEVGESYVGSASICGANANDELLVVVNEQNLVAPGDTFLVYNGFNY